MFLSELIKLEQNNSLVNTKLTILAFTFKVLASSNSDRSIDVRKMSVEDVSSTVQEYLNHNIEFLMRYMMDSLNNYERLDHLLKLQH